MSLQSRRAIAILIWIHLVPCFFFTLWFGWGVIDDHLGVGEVSRFIRKHQPIVAARLANPKVHSFSLAHDPDHPATLLIRFDVEDRATYLMLEDDLDEHWGLRFPARWDTRLRSDEELGNNFGFAGQGLGEIGEGMWRLLIVAVISVVLPAVLLSLALRRFQDPPTKRAKGDGNGIADEDNF